MCIVLFLNKFWQNSTLWTEKYKSDVFVVVNLQPFLRTSSYIFFKILIGIPLTFHSSYFHVSPSYSYPYFPYIKTQCNSFVISSLMYFIHSTSSVQNIPLLFPFTFISSFFSHSLYNIPEVGETSAVADMGYSWMLLPHYP